MSVTDDLYCLAVARSDAEACKAWLQAGRDHKWTATTSSASLLIPLVLLAVVVVALWVAARAMRSTRAAKTNAAGDAVGDAPATPGRGTAPSPPRYECVPGGAYRLTDAPSTTSPA